MSFTEEPSRALQIFYSYAHEDQKLRDRLEKHLKILQRQGKISNWHDRKISAGTEWATEINVHLNTADIILLLISPDFMASDYCYSVEVEQAMARHEARKARVVPVILRPVYWEEASFSKLQALPTNAKPASRWRNLDEAFLDISLGIRNVIEDILASRVSRKAAGTSEETQRAAKEEENKDYLEASYYFGLATEAYRSGDNTQAIKLYLQVLRLQPNNTRVLERLGRAYNNLNDMKEARSYLEQALAIDPSNVSVLRSLALIYRYSDKEKAIEYLNLSVKINPLDYEAWDFLGLLYRDERLIDKAIFAHEKALGIKKRPETQFYLSILYLLRGNKRRAKLMALSAENDLQNEEHNMRIRPVWKILIQVGVSIVENNKEEAYHLLNPTNDKI